MTDQRKDKSTWLLVGLVLLAVMAAAYFIVWPYVQRQTTLRIGDGVFKASIHIASHEPQNDWLQTNELSESKAAIRVYPHDERWEIDVQDRVARHDIIWLDQDKKVVHIVKNASSESTIGTVLTPERAARYVIELRGGMVESKTINLNSIATFDEKEVEGER